MSSTDLITSDPTIVGRVLANGGTDSPLAGLTRFQASVNGSQFVDLRSLLNPDGSFTMGPEILRRIGLALPYGGYQVRFIVGNALGTAETTLTFRYTP